MRRTPRRGFATVIVLLAIAIATVVLIDLQSSALRQATAGREAVARVRAEWAARAGLESSISVLGNEAELNSENVTAYQVYDALDRVAAGQLKGVEFEVYHTEGEDERLGVADAHVKVNVNLMSFDDLMELVGMTEDTAAAILDWIDEDDLVRDLGAEDGYYLQLPSPYEPRNGFIRSLLELELVAGVRSEDVRGEDWNLNGRLDPNENDGDTTWPPDDADGVLDAGWSEFITAESVDVGLGISGEERLLLLDADERQLQARVEGLDPLQARVILDYANREGARVEDLIGTPLVTIAQTVPGLGAPAQSVRELEEDQLQTLIDETTVRDPDDGPAPGRLNINTIEREVLDYVTSLSAGQADQLIFVRDSRPEGFVGLLDLLNIIDPGTLVELSRILDTRSNAFVVTARGRDINTGIEAEIIATIERTSLPIVITELTVR
ncbi:MAG: hypothetical protein AAFX05_10925 [Planctomycetota bacterium]